MGHFSFRDFRMGLSTGILIGAVLGAVLTAIPLLGIEERKERGRVAKKDKKANDLMGDIKYAAYLEENQGKVMSIKKIEKGDNLGELAEE